MEERYSTCASHGFLLRLALFLPLFLSVSMAAATTTTAASLPLNKTQEAILRNLSRLVNTPSVTTRWNTADSNPCLWSGITCSSSSNSSSFSVVTNLTLSGYGIDNSSIFASICALDSLQILDLSRNSITKLTDQFFTSSCSMKEGLRSLNLSSNQLANSLSSLSGFRRLEVLDLSFNSFISTNLSTDLGSFSRLKSLNLSTNNFVGHVLPTSMVSSLEELVLSKNQFVDGIPMGLFEYVNLTMLDLSQNNLTGHVPDEFSKLPKLQTLLLSGNILTGPIPRTLLTVTTLSRFAANQNKLSGMIPSGITKHVRMLDLSYNKLSGEIPPDLFFASSLETVDLSNNMLEGPIPGDFSNSLYRLRLGGNFLNGTIPESIGNALNLSYLELDRNKLGGGIPSQLGACKRLALLNLALNSLQGPVPREISNLENLQVLKLQMNNLNGTIPNTISDFGNLAILNLSLNAFIGEIPAGLFQLSNLTIINLQGNKIDGTIPSSVSSLGNLIELNLGNNSLTGSIPSMPTSLKTALNLSNNHLTGAIPSNIGSLSDLEILDLSFNDLSGPIPSSLSSLQSLTLLVLSHNHLSGPLPMFRQHVVVDATGNPDLNSNGTATSGKRRTHTVVIIIFAVAGALIGLCLLSAIVMISFSKRIYRVEDEGPPAEEGISQIINGHLITMNSIHTSAIDFVKAMEAVSYHSNIFLKTRFCTYYKAVMPNGSTYSVKKLNWSDKIFQIGSQEKFGHELEVLGKLSNSNVMVPLAYALTEDNAYILYEHVHKGTVFDFLHAGRSDVLDWHSRYSIAFGLAQGLTFLHGCTQPVLLLDLSTRTIHLKSMNEPQIGDIELYKIIDPSKSSGSLSTIAGTVGYIPPEYAYTMRLTTAGNVYSFGVILLELLTGKPSVSDGIELAKWALSLSGSLVQREQILDTRVARTSIAVHSQMLSVLNIALACVALSPDARPKMRNVSRMLLNAK